MGRCTACGRPVEGDWIFCRACGADQQTQQSVRPDWPSDASPYGQAEATSYQSGPSPYPPGVPPYAAGQLVPAPRRSSPGIWVAAALVVAGLACFAVWLVLGRSADPEPVAAGATATSPAPPNGVASQPSGQLAVPTVTVTQPLVRTVTQVAPAPEAVQPAPPQAAPQQPVPPVQEPASLESQLPSGSYVLVLESFPKSKYSVGTARAKAAGLGATVIDSSRVPGLNSGFWAVIHSRYFWNKSEAQATCSSYGRSVGGPCYARKIG